MVISKKSKITNSGILVVLLMLGIFLGYFFTNIPRFAEILTILYAGAGLLFAVINRKIKQRDYPVIILAIIVAVYAHSTEGIRYFLLIIALFTWAKFKYTSILLLARILVWFGLVTSVTQIKNGLIRIEGFAHNSPPQFSCYMLICFVYLVIYYYNKAFVEKVNRSELIKCRFILIEIAISIFLIFLSGTRSTLLFAVAIGMFFVLCAFVQKSGFKQKKLFFFMIIIVAAILVLLLSNSVLDLYYSKLARNATLISDSNRTRAALLGEVFGEIKRNPIMIIIGKGGGYVEQLLKSRYGITEYLPVHQDFVLILAEYGIVGLIALYCVLLKKHKAAFVFLMMFIPCSFHNIVLNTRAMLMMTLVIVEIENKGLHYMPLKKRTQ